MTLIIGNIDPHVVDELIKKSIKHLKENYEYFLLHHKWNCIIVANPSDKNNKMFDVYFIHKRASTYNNGNKIFKKGDYSFINYVFTVVDKNNKEQTSFEKIDNILTPQKQIFWYRRRMLWHDETIDYRHYKKISKTGLS